MSWDHKKGGRAGGYFYLSKRVPGKPYPIKIYKGRSTAGHEAAAQVEQRRLCRPNVKRRLREERKTEDEIQTAELHAWAYLLSQVWLILTGHHKHHAHWRMKMKMKSTRKPKEGSVAWDKEISNNPEYAKNTIQDLAKRAESGDRDAVDRLIDWLKKYPEMRSLVRELDDLAIKVERCWIVRICSKDEVSKKALQDELLAMKEELLSRPSTVTERILASSVITAYLSFQCASISTAIKTDNPGEQEVRSRLLSLAQKRLIEAIKAWDRIEKKKAKGLRVRSKIKLFEPAEKSTTQSKAEAV